MHTNLSRDGTLTIEQLSKFLKDKGYDYIAITEHSPDVDQAKLAELDRKARHLSNEKFLILPGIEFTCRHDIHILGLGVTELCHRDDPGTVIDHIHACGGVAVLAHPAIMDYPFEPGWIAKLDGCEIWNNNEGKVFPQPRSVKCFWRLRRWNRELKAFGGIDLHKTRHFYGISTITWVNILDRGNVLAALSEGRFRIDSRFYSVDSEARMHRWYLWYTLAGRRLMNVGRWIKHGLGG